MDIKRIRKSIENERSDVWVAAFICVLALLSLIPLIICAFHNYATGDDLLYGSVVKDVIRNGGNAIDALKAIFADIKEEYYGFQGTWSSGFMWRIEPSIWGENLYKVTFFIAFTCIVGGTGAVLHYILVRMIGIKKNVYVVITVLLSLMMIQYMPYPRGGMYWYTGMMQYTFSYGIASLSIRALLKYVTERKFRYMVIMLLTGAYLGGGGYPVVVYGIVVYMFAFLGSLLLRRGEKGSAAESKRINWEILIPLALIIIGFIIDFLAPGNSNRAGVELGFDPGYALMTVLRCIPEGLLGGFRFMINARPLILIFVLVIVYSFECIDIEKSRLRFDHPIWVVVASILTMCSVYCPVLYTGNDVAAGISGGVYDVYFFVFVISTGFMLVYLTGFFKKKIIEKGTEIRIRNIRTYVTIVIVLFGTVFFRHLIGSSVFYVSSEYIEEGHLADFEMQMQERLKILQDDSIRNAVLEPINEYQGPIMHMPVTGDPDAYTNQVTTSFYGKDSVVEKQYE
ncbi:MAG: hypothetical protein K6A38_10215 [Lachnospiraceae bacterium]|nr:hypothetical protein [Lachnospiraceae bacterium]